MNRRITELWQASAPLTAVGFLMLAFFVAAVAGLIFDPKTIGGAPGWLKPAKFAISTAIYAFSFAWVFRYLNYRGRLMRWTGGVMAAVLAFEVAVIGVQAWRGTTSHFNVSTRLDGMLFTAMGTGIGVVWVGSVVVLGALSRRRFEDPAWGWALRLGVLITVIGSSAGGLMLGPTAAQREQARTTHRMTAAGAHTVGAPDGGPGMPGSGWSTQHGDLRVPHFFGMHALQIVPLLAWLGRRARRRMAVAPVIAASYFALWGILCWQALRGQSLAAPDALTLTAAGFWLAGTVGAALWLRASAKAYRGPSFETCDT